jgi:L-fuculose-phosphate aldolase
VHRLDGAPVEAPLAPTSELPLHLAIYAGYAEADAIAAVVHTHSPAATLMGNHGAVTIGPDLRAAHDRSQYLEWLCDVYLRASAAGSPRLLPADEVRAVAAKLATYGQSAAGRQQATMTGVNPSEPR